MTRAACWLLCWLVPLCSFALTLLEQSPAQVMHQADVVVLGTVVAQRPLQHQGLIHTQFLVRVEETLKGPSTATLVVTQLGGRLGTVEMDVPGDRPLHIGERVVLATYAHADGNRYLVGMRQGIFDVTPSSSWSPATPPPFTLDGLRRLAAGRAP